MRSFNFKCLSFTNRIFSDYMFRSHGYEDTRYHRKLTNVEGKTLFPVDSKTKCTTRCSADPKCISVNFCLPKSCSFNFGDAFTKGTELISDPFCIYVGMKRDYVPRCYEQGAIKLITNDYDPGICQINQKRQDPIWTDVDVDYDNDNGELKKLVLVWFSGRVWFIIF